MITLTATQPRTCRKCGHIEKIEADGIEMDRNTSYFDIFADIDIAAHEKGWRNGYCPACANEPQTARRLAEEERADDK